MSDAIHDDELFLSEEEVVDYIAEFKKAMCCRKENQQDNGK